MGHNPNGNYTHSILTNRAMTTPDKIALTHVVHGDITYGELQARVNRRANALLSLGIEPRTRVACLTYDQLATVEIYLAVAQIGAVLVTANSFWDDETLAALLERANCEAFIYDAHCQEQADRAAARLGTVRTWMRIGGAAEGAIDLDELTASASSESTGTRGSWDDPVLLTFTSGTTGLPKAVTHTHGSCIENARLWTDVPRGHDPILYAGTAVVGIIFASTVAPALWGGVRLILEEDGGLSEFVSAVQRYKVTHFSTVVSFFTAALRAASESADLRSLRAVLLGGEPVTRSSLELIHDRIPGARVFSFYGQSEAPYSCITYNTLDPADDDAVHTGYTVQTGYSAKVVDGDGNRIVGEVGEIWLGGPHLMSGYDSEPEKTAGVLRDGWYVGGDLGLMDEAGTLTVYGRREDATLREGKFVLPSEVEEYALGLTGISEVGAVAVASVDDQKILLAVVLTPGFNTSSDEILKQLRNTVPATHLPDAVLIVEELPYASNMAGRGKLLRREIGTRWGSVVAGA
jgi:acyl-CoA synthetase (AMP-forming)/AMP-acid ligase II